MPWPWSRKKATPQSPPGWPPIQIENLSFAIFGAACRCATSLKQLTGYDESGVEGKWRDLDLTMEHLALFLNLADRTAFAVYGPNGRARLSDDLLCWTFETTMRTYFGDDWSNGDKTVLQFGDGLTAKLDECQAIYGGCGEILSPQPSPWQIDHSDEANPHVVSDCAVGRLSIRAAAICGHPRNQEVLFQAMRVAVDEHVHMNLESLVREAGAVLGLEPRT